LCELLRDHLQQAGVLEICNAGVVLTGGGSRLNGLREVCDKMLDRPVRLASPVPIAKMPAQLAEPEFATVIGLAMYAHRTTAARMIPEQGLGTRLKTFLARLGA
jgi:cell division protein FtsA